VPNTLKNFYACSVARLVTRTVVLLGGSVAGVLGLTYAFA